MTCLLGFAGCRRRGEWQPGGTATPLRDGRSNDLECWWGEPPCHLDPQRIIIAVQELWLASVSLACPPGHRSGELQAWTGHASHGDHLYHHQSEDKGGEEEQICPRWPNLTRLSSSAGIWNRCMATVLLSKSYSHQSPYYTWPPVMNKCKIGLVQKSCYTLCIAAISTLLFSHMWTSSKLMTSLKSHLMMI